MLAIYPVGWNHSISLTVLLSHLFGWSLHDVMHLSVIYIRDRSASADLDRKNVDLDAYAQSSRSQCSAIVPRESSQHEAVVTVTHGAKR